MFFSLTQKRNIGCLYLQSLLLEAVLFFCMKIFLLQAKTTQRIPLHYSTCSSSEIFAVCRVNNTVRCALEVTVWPANRKRNNISVSIAYQQKRKCCWQYIMCSPWKIWITCLVSKVLSITLLSALMAVSISTVRVFTLCGKKRVQGQNGHILHAQQSTRSYYRPDDVHLLTQPSVTTLFLSSHSSPLEICTIPSPQYPSSSGAFSIDWNGVSWSGKVFHRVWKEEKLCCL